MKCLREGCNNEFEQIIQRTKKYCSKTCCSTDATRRDRKRDPERARQRVRNYNYKKKQYILDNLGNCCQICGYDKYSGALDCHHINPDLKRDDFRGSMTQQCLEVIDQELPNLILLCRNCHAEVGAGIIELPD